MMFEKNIQVSIRIKKITCYFGTWQEFSNMFFYWLAPVLPANEEPC